MNYEYVNCEIFIRVFFSNGNKMINTKLLCVNKCQVVGLFAIYLLIVFMALSSLLIDLGLIDLFCFIAIFEICKFLCFNYHVRVSCKLVSLTSNQEQSDTGLRFAASTKESHIPHKLL